MLGLYIAENAKLRPFYIEGTDTEVLAQLRAMLVKCDEVTVTSIEG
jgi:hypothetical protein